VGKLACLRAQSAAVAGCEARSAEHPADGNTRRLLPSAERPATTLPLTRWLWSAVEKPVGVQGLVM